MEDRGETQSIALCLTHSLRLPADTRQSTLGHNRYPNSGHRLEDPSSSLCNFPHRKCHPHLLYNFSIASNCGATHPRFPPSSSNDVPVAQNRAVGGLHAGVRSRHLGRWRMRSSSASCLPYSRRPAIARVRSAAGTDPLRCAMRYSDIRTKNEMGHESFHPVRWGPRPLISQHHTHYHSTLTIVGRPTRGMMTASFKPMKGGVERRIIPERTVTARPNHQSPRHLLSSNPPSGSGGKCWKPFVATNPAR
ncbi:hypothetical protein BDP55DRAFT_259018 [Colletotrichum godetiae]|uniref:Uncharacterized protein n=1 Tax=Colletotrichum godetiae TaxID=1209918 RepID=A0AAJ0AX75_9PEZI|nr:uncharacterized protein BDP55DRAFT_259018 [Colletotrichum godetiae]KAK1691247.1 hypothetical protein BDP55DRAFT_259018 [Colletotrichum godetiae]